MITVDRFEGSYAILETDDGIVRIKRSLMPDDAREGDVLRRSGEGYSVDRRETGLRRKAASDRLNKLLRGEYD